MEQFGGIFLTKTEGGRKMRNIGWTHTVRIKQWKKVQYVVVVDVVVLEIVIEDLDKVNGYGCEVDLK